MVVGRYSLSHFLCILVAAQTLGGCTEASLVSLSCSAGTKVQALVQGERNTTYLGLSESQRNAVASFQALDEEQNALTFCSATLVAPQVALTAAHCILEGASHFRVRFSQLPSFELGRSAVSVHPSLDIALLTIPEISATEVTPLSFRSSGSPEVGELVEIAGLSHWEGRVSGEADFGVVAVTGLEKESIVVSSDHVAPCNGDSGGPLLWRDRDGRLVVGGVLSWGSRACVGQDHYLRLSAIDSWLEERIPVTETVSSCEALGRRGRCFGQVAVFCEEQQERRDVCGQNEVCGWHDELEAYRCLSSKGDPCLGIPDTGICAGDSAIRCAQGQLRSLNCVSCGARCSFSSVTGEAFCATQATDE